MHLNEQRLRTPWQQMVFAKLLVLQYKIIYRKGSENTAVDALTCRGHSPQLLAISVVTPSWLSDVVADYQHNPEATAFLAQLTLKPDSRLPYAVLNGVIRYKSHIWLGSNTALQRQVISALHSSPLGGHSGAPITQSKIKQLFYWVGMKHDIWDYVQNCSTCLQSKPDRAKCSGLLQPLPSSWAFISMDFVEGLPCSGSANAILVVVDRYSKFAHFIPLLHPFTALSVARLFLDNVYKLHGMPQASDRDKIFTSTPWKLLFNLSGIELQLISLYHPQTDGQTE